MEHTSAVAAAAMPSAASGGLSATSDGILQGGWEAARTVQPPVEGRCTGCVVTVERDAAGGGTLNATVLGDSGFMVLKPGGRHGWMVRYTCDEERIEEQQHYFNCPFQLGTLGGGEMNTPADAFHASVALEKDDVVIVATDGLFDTLFDEDIVNLFNECALTLPLLFSLPLSHPACLSLTVWWVCFATNRKLGDPRLPLEDAAEELVIAAQFAGAYGSPCRAITEDGAERLTGRTGDTPFGVRAKEEGFISRPGEAIDDVAVVVVRLD